MRCFLIATFAIAASAQPQPPAFEAASIKPARPGRVRIDSDPARLSIHNESVEVLIEVAFGLREHQYQGPSWLHTARYDIVATTPSPQPRSAQLIMLRALLAERFKLTTHHESRNMPVYELVVAKGGFKLHPIDERQPVPFEPLSNFEFAPAPGDFTELRGIASLGQLSNILTRLAGRPVVDRTGITGAFDIRLICAVDGYPGYETSPSVFDAVQSQLGLKLEPRTAPIDITVVDHIEKPTEN